MKITAAEARVLSEQAKKAVASVGFLYKLIQVTAHKGLASVNFYGAMAEWEIKELKEQGFEVSLNREDPRPHEHYYIISW